jgi:hypothetical protein
LRRQLFQIALRFNLAVTESERLWRVWWLWGLPVAWVTGALIVFAEVVRTEGYGDWGHFLDLVRLLVYWWWLRMAWKCARNVEHRFWTVIAKTALSVGLLVNVLA